MNSLKEELEQLRMSLVTESESYYDVNKKCDDIKYVMDEWFQRLQKRGDKEAYVDSISNLSKKISELKQSVKSDIDVGNSILYVPDNQKLLAISAKGISDITDKLISYMKSVKRFYSMDSSETDKFFKEPDKIESMMDEFDSDIDNCFVTKKPMSVSGYLVITDELIDSIDEIMNNGIIDNLLDVAKSYANEYISSTDGEFTKRDFSNIESMFRLLRSFFGSLRLYIGKSYGNICTNTQRIHDLLQ